MQETQDDEDCFKKPLLQTHFEMEYNELYTSLEHIGKLINNGTASNCDIEEQYSGCNAVIENLLVEETYPAFIDSLQQLQESLSVQMRLLREINSSPCINSSSSNINVTSSSNSSSSQTTTTNDGSDSATGSHFNREQESEEDGRNSRSRAIAATKKSPACDGLHQVAGLEEAKQLFQEALILPNKYPHLFQGCRQPWSRVLLYGPPGTGKTRLAHAVAAEINADFYCISTADLLSSWVGESEKMIRELFNLPNRDQSPDSKSKKAIIFIDEIDSLCRRRSSSEAEHARRLKTELLIQIEEAAKKGIFLLCATNCPWDLDPAFLRRFQRRIYIPTPNRDARQAILQLHSGLAQKRVEEDGGDDASGSLDWTPVLDGTEGYSGSDLAALTQYALLQPIRELQHATCWAFKKDGLIAPCDATHPSVMTCSLKELPPNMVGVRDVDMSDFLKALSCTPRTISKEDLNLYENFTQKYGQPL